MPVVLVNNRELIKPPEIYFGRLNRECIEFANKYYNLGQSYYKANNGLPFELVSVNEEFDSKKYYIPELCIAPLYIKVFYLGNTLPYTSLVTNSMTIANQCVNKKNVDKRSKSLLLKIVQEKIMLNNLEIANAIETEFYKNNKLFLLWINQRYENKLKKYLVFIEKYKGDYNVVSVDSLFNSQNGYTTFTEKFLLDVIDIDNDKFNEIIFYYNDDKEIYGFQIYKKSWSNWILYYETKYGCY